MAGLQNAERVGAAVGARRAVSVIVKQAERADVTDRLLELGEVDVGVAGLAPQQDEAARPGGDPAEP